jgi:hypothetical protein
MMAMFGWTGPKMLAHYIAKDIEGEPGKARHERHREDRSVRSKPIARRAYGRARRELREAGNRKILDLQDCVPVALRVAVRIELGHVTTNHQARHIDRLQFVRRMAGDNTAVARHCHLVGDLLNLRQPVRNIEDAHALARISAMTLSNARVSIGVSEAVGSSKITTR